MQRVLGELRVGDAFFGGIPVPDSFKLGRVWRIRRDIDDASRRGQPIKGSLGALQDLDLLHIKNIIDVQVAQCDAIQYDANRTLGGASKRLGADATYLSTAAR